MASWQVQQAKARLSELIEDADAHGPQIITHHGAEKAVVLSIEDYRALANTPKQDLRDYLLNAPKVDGFHVRRSRDTGRKITL